MKVHTVSEFTPLPYKKLGAKWGWVVNATPRPIYPRGKRRDSYCSGGMDGCENEEDSCPLGVRTRDREARSQSLY